MKSADERLENFSRVVLEKAFKVRESMEKDLKKRTEKILGEKEIFHLEEAYKKIQTNKAKIIQEVNEKISNTQFECKKELIKRRGEIVKEIFDNVLIKIKDFINSDSYYTWLLDKAKNSVEAIMENNNTIVVCINNTDKKYINKLQEDLDGYFKSNIIELSVTNDDIIGGIIVLNKQRNYLMDFSIKESINNAKNQFLKQSGLSIE